MTYPLEDSLYICGIDAAMDVVGGKWKGLILWALQDGARRFSELRRELPGVSEKMLTQQLRELERDGIVHREVFQQVPPKVEYTLTRDGFSLNEALRALGAWGRDHQNRIESIRGFSPRTATDPAARVASASAATS